MTNAMIPVFNLATATSVTYVTNYMNYYTTPRFDVEVLKTKVDASSMYLEVKM
jgi:hypothetical protein